MLPLHWFFAILRRMGVAGRFVLGFTFALLATIAARAEETVVVSGETGEGRGRLIFDWPDPVIFSAQIDEGRLVVRFARRFDAYFGRAIMALEKYVEAGGIYQDRRTAVFALRRPVTVVTRNEGNRAVVELIDPAPPPSATPRPRPPAAAQAPPPPKAPAPLAVSPVVPEPAVKPAAKPMAETAAPSPLEKPRALFGQGKATEALAVLEGVTGLQADRLRQDIYWRLGDWTRAAPLALSLAERAPAGAELSDAAARQVLNAAVAAVLANDGPALTRLRARFGQAMEQTAQRYPFRLIADGGERIDDRAKSARAVADAEGFARYLARWPAGNGQIR